MRGRGSALLVLLAGLWFAGPAQAAVEREAVEGLGDFDADGIVDGAREPARAGDARAELRARLTGETCRRRSGAAWAVDGIPVPSASPAECRHLVGPLAEGEHTLALGEDVSFTVTAVEHLVASIGDSVASGEGNPDRRADL